MLRKRLVQAEVAPEARELLGGEDGRGPQTRGDRVPREEPDEEEREQADANERRDRSGEARREVATHGPIPTLGARCQERVTCPARSGGDR